MISESYPDRLSLEAFFLLMNTPPVININVIKIILEKINNIEELFTKDNETINTLDINDKVKEKLLFKLENSSLNNLKNTISEIQCEIKLYIDSSFPSPLKEIKIPPIMLFCKGNTSLLENIDKLAIVGTRKASNYGKYIVNNYISGLKAYNKTIITGTALGIDCNIIQKAIEEKIPCISVLSSGINKISPKTNANLLNELIENNGCIITEFPPNTNSHKSNYPIRAKVIASLADKIIIIQAPKNSGALLVANEGFEIMKNILCPPSDYTDLSFEGSHELIESGVAALMEDISDINEIL